MLFVRILGVRLLVDAGSRVMRITKGCAEKAWDRASGHVLGIGFRAGCRMGRGACRVVGSA